MSSDADLKKYFNPKATTSTSRIDHNRAKDEDNHKYKDDPKSVTNFISKQLLELSLNDRNAILEETHGVRCLAPEETPNFISVALEKLAAEIDKLPIHQKSAYLQSQQHQSGNSETTQTTSTSTSTSTSTYVNTVDFRLRFLRVKLFDAQQAAKHLVKYLEVALEYFGTYALFRPVKLSDFTKEELRVFRTGVAQFLPFRDRHGRRVIVTFMSERVEEISQKLRMKILLYMTYTMGTGDPEQQRKGVVAILWWQDEAKYQFKVTPEHARVQTREFAPIRISALHICTPDTPFFGFVRSMFAMTFHRKVMSRIRFHAGNSVELRYALESHGISMDQMPITWTGNIKEQYFKQWMRLRQIFEDDDHKSCEIIVCPQLNDVLFRQGTSAMHHPGNVLFRSRIQHLYENAKAHTVGRSTRTIVQKLIEEIQNNKGRVLIWYQSKNCSNSNDCWWTELKDEGQIYTKIKNLVRELKFSKAKHQVINRGDCQTTIVVVIFKTQ